MDPHGWSRTLSDISIALELAVGARFYFSRIARTYRWFMCFLVADAFASVLVLAAQSSRGKLILWICSQPPIWLLAFTALFELCSLVMAGYPRIFGLVRWAILLATGIAVLCALSMYLDPHDPRHMFHVLRATVQLRPVVFDVLAVSLLVPWLFLVGFSIPLRRNLVVHGILFTAFIWTIAVAGFLVDQLGSGYRLSIETGTLAAADVYLVGWVFFIGPRGEQAPPASTHGEQVHRRLTQLMNFEQALARACSSGAH